MNNKVVSQPLRIALIGGGPSALYMLKKLVQQDSIFISIHVFEKKQTLGAGMPYSEDGAGAEHITNVSANEIPDLRESLDAWVNRQDPEWLKGFAIDREKFHEYKVVPRLLFGEYLSAQFKDWLSLARQKGIDVQVHTETTVTDIRDKGAEGSVHVQINNDRWLPFEKAIICSGHYWPVRHEGNVKNYFDSPYPPHKLRKVINSPVAIRGSSLTAIDAIRTLARANGSFRCNEAERVCSYTLNQESSGFRMILFSRSGLLPAVRFHLEESRLYNNDGLTDAEVKDLRAENDGFLPLDKVFEFNFKKPLRDSNPSFYEKIRDMNMEEFVEHVMSFRENMPPFELLKKEYSEAEQSIRNKESIHWKEMLGSLSFTMNYPAKYFSGEDMQRLHKTLLPLISIVIAYVPQSSVEEILALYEAGILELVSAGDNCEVLPRDEGGAIISYENDGEKTERVFDYFVDCIGQPHLSLEDLPFPGLVNTSIVAGAKVKFKDPETGLALHAKGDEKVKPEGNCCYLSLAGIAINDSFQVVNENGEPNERLFMMAVPFMGGFNPDYSGLDFCDKASDLIASELKKQDGMLLAS